MRVLPPGGPPQRVSSGPFPGAEPHIFCKAKPVKLKKVAFSHFFDTLQGGKRHPVFYTFFQVSGVKTIIIGNISSLPMSISSVSTILDKAEKSE